MGKVDKHSRLNKTFRDMKARCYNPKNKEYKNYGARGITVCDEWLNAERVPEKDNATKGYLLFKEWALSNGYADNLTIDRIDVNKGYSPDNCRWVDVKTQMNNRRCNHYITYKGRTQTLMQWCEELNLNYDRTKARLNILHWTVEKAFTKEAVGAKSK